MLESDAKKKKCPHFATANAVMLLSLTRTYLASRQTVADDAVYEKSAAMLGRECLGSGCVMWEPVYEKETKEFLVDPPAEESWHADPGVWMTKHPHGKMFFRYVSGDHGDCGLKSLPLECNPCAN